MFWRRKSARQPSLYLGNIAVSSAPGLKKLFSNSSSAFTRVDDRSIEQVLHDLVALPPVVDRASRDSSDLALDITVADHNSGALPLNDLFSFGIPVAWRPEVVMAARVYRIETNETVVACSVRQKPDWDKWLGKIAKVRTYINDGWSIDREEMEHLVRQACVNLLQMVQKELR